MLRWSPTSTVGGSGPSWKSRSEQEYRSFECISLYYTSLRTDLSSGFTSPSRSDVLKMVVELYDCEPRMFKEQFDKVFRHRHRHVISSR